MTVKKKTPSRKGAERRRSKRLPIAESFSIFGVLPKKGGHRLKIRDLSEHGVSIEAEIEGEPLHLAPIELGEKLEFHFYLNQGLFLPLEITVTRLDSKGSHRKIGGEIKDRKSPEFKAYSSFISFLDALSETRSSTKNR